MAEMDFFLMIFSLVVTWTLKHFTLLEFGKGNQRQEGHHNHSWTSTTSLQGNNQTF